MEFNHSLVIRWLREALNNSNNPVDNPPVPEMIQEIEEFIKCPPNEWDLTHTSPNDILDIMILEELLISLPRDTENELMEMHLSHYGITHFDPTPGARLTITGWLNVIHSRDYEELMQELPPISLLTLHQVVDEMVSNSRVCDLDIFSDLEDDIDNELIGYNGDTSGSPLLEFLYQPDNYTYISNINFALLSMGRILQQVYEAYPSRDGLIYDIAYEVISRGHELVDCLEDDIDFEDLKFHPMWLIREQINEMIDMYT